MQHNEIHVLVVLMVLAIWSFVHVVFCIDNQTSLVIIFVVIFFWQTFLLVSF